MMGWNYGSPSKRLTRTFGNHMAGCGQGTIINVGSVQGVGGPDYTLYENLGWGVAPDYFFHKGGLLQLTRFAASKLGLHGVRVKQNKLRPGRGRIRHALQNYDYRFDHSNGSCVGQFGAGPTVDPPAL